VAVVCPTITAYTEDEYKLQMDRIVHFGQRVQIDLTDGVFTNQATITPDKAWWPIGFTADFHLMYREPKAAIGEILKHKPNLIMVHAEANIDIRQIADYVHTAGVKFGLALLASTPVEDIFDFLPRSDHVLIFSGNLGRQGGSVADLTLLSKVQAVKERKKEIEIGWDGGVNDQNAAELILGGVDVLNVGGFLQNNPEPEKSYHILQRIAEETGTT
jgi:ribulose-phosphate 3-epimerase